MIVMDLGQENEGDICHNGQSWNGHMGMLWAAEWGGGWQRSWFGWSSNSTFVAICWGH